MSNSSVRYTMCKTPPLKVNKCVLVPAIVKHYHSYFLKKTTMYFKKVLMMDTHTK